MNKAKIVIETTVEGQTTVEKYICRFDPETIEYTDKQKTKTILKFDEEKAEIRRHGFVNYNLVHDGTCITESLFETMVEGQPFSMNLKIENKYYKLSKYGKILSIEIHFMREDNCLVKQNFKVEEK
ncbi:DUF1934 family protein [Mollicutes bacterium LVI A0039]|nr:DUF1934 family protein [Mollicutes bacterium LVI A0039]